MSEIFSNCSLLISLPDISNWDTSNVISMSKIFNNCQNLSFLPDISNWNIENVIYMEKMFSNCSSLSLIPNISNWNLNNVFKMKKIFHNCLNLSSLPNIFGWYNIGTIINDFHSLICLSDISKIKINNKNFCSMNEKTITIINLLYETEGERTISIFHPLFVLNNKKKCKMIINNKLFPLNDVFHITDYKNNLLKIKLIILNNIKINFLFMFFSCKYLKKFSVISPKEIKSEETFKIEQDKSRIKKINISYSDATNGDSSKLFYHDYTKKSQISIKGEEKIKYIINRSHDFSSQSFSLEPFDYKINNINGYDSIQSKIEIGKIKNGKNLDIYFNQNKSYSHFSSGTIIVTDLSYMFYNCSSLIYISGISKFDTCSVESLVGMFKRCSSLKSVIDISQWKMNQDVDIGQMFDYCTSLEIFPDFTKWNLNRVQYMKRKFTNYSKSRLMPNQTKLNIKNEDNIGDSSDEIIYDYSSVKYLADTITISLNKNILNQMKEKIHEKKIDIYMYYKYKSDEEGSGYEKQIMDYILQNIDDDIKKLRLFGQVFVNNNKENCRIIYKNSEYELTEYLDDIDNYYNPNELILIKLRIIKELTDMSYMFSGCKALISFPDIIEENENVSEISKITAPENNSYLGSYIKKDFLKNLISCLNTKKVNNMKALFAGCISLSYLSDSLNWNTSNVTDMSYMFFRCKSLFSIPNLSKWETNNVKNLENIFLGCDELIAFPDLSNWNTDKLTLMGGMFYGCKSLLSLPDISKWNISNVSEINCLFLGCRALKSLPNISKWNTSKVTDMSFMFEECSSLESFPDISN